MRPRFAVAAMIAILVLSGCGKKEPEAGAPTPATQPNNHAVGGQPGQPPEKKGLTFPPRSAVGVPYKAPKKTVKATKPAIDEGLKFTGLPSYPAAKFLSGPYDSTKEVKGKTVTIKAEFTTPDQPVAVLEFYKKLLKVDSYSVNGAAAYMSGTTAKGDMVVVASVADKDNKSLTHFQVFVTRRK